MGKANPAPSLTPDRVSPSNVEAEEAVLGSVLINPDALLDVATFLRAEDFFLVKNGWIWDAILAVQERREPIDFLTVTNELESQQRLQEAGGQVYISRLMDAVPSAIHAEAYGRIVERTSLRRRLLGAASEVAQLACNEAENIEVVLDKSEQALFGVSERRLTRDLQPIKRVVNEYYDRVKRLSEHDELLMGVPTGFRVLDELLGGLQRSDLIIVAGRPGMGKTGLLLNIALNCARHHRMRVACFSLEMSAEQVVGRLVAAETGIDSQRLRRGALRQDEWPLFTEATGRLADTLIFIDDTPSITPLQLRTKCRRLYAEYGIDLIVLDYLQLMSGDFRSENRVQEISYISRHLKGMAREMNVPVLAAAQLSRAVEQRQDKHPMLSDLRESGCLAGDTLVQLADGNWAPIKELTKNGASFSIRALNQETWKLESVEARKAWRTGTKPVLRLTTGLGHSIRATGNHRFRTHCGWRRLDGLEIGEYIALPRPLGISQSVSSEVHWDQVFAIDPDGMEDVYDLEAPRHHNFVANDIIVHNSIEQDADVVMFIYRDEYYTKNETESPNIAEIVIAKHRNGPTGRVDLYFQEKLAQFRELERHQFAPS
jgi:replicative DNA helicase